MKKSKKASWLALLAGGLTPLAFSPIGFFPLAVLMPAVLLYLWLDKTPKQALWLGWLYGIGFFGIGVSWIYISIHKFGNTPVLLAGIFTGIFVLILAVFPAIQGYFLARWFPNHRLTTLLLVFPITWILLEWVRGWFLTGFPWLLLAYSQVSSPLNGLIPLLGEWGTGFVILFSSGLLVGIYIVKKSPRYILLAGLVLLWTISGLLGQIQWTSPSGKPLSVLLTQGNIPQNLKWDESYINRTLETYARLTYPYWGTDIIVWPESAIPLPMHRAKEFIETLSKEAKKQKTGLLVGIPVKLIDQDSYYNGFHGFGEGSGSYYKRRLVPFGEYVPLDAFLRGAIAFLNIPMSNFESGGDSQANLYVRDIPIAPFICYEIAYAYIVRQHLPQAQLLVTVSNVAWFGDSLAPWQHLEMGRFRALQTGRYHLLDGNAGITAVIDDKGRVQKRIPQFQTAVLKDVVQPMVGATPWVYWSVYWGGDWPLLGLMLIVLLALLLVRKFGRDGRI
jgi:apolipoprotein N-acyltransferase